MERMISLVGLGAVGAPLSDILYKKYKDDFALLSSKLVIVHLKRNAIFSGISLGICAI